MQYMFPRVRYQCQLKGFWSSLDLFLEPELTSRSDKSVGASYYPQWSFSENLLTPKGGGRFTFASTTNISHQVDLISLRIPCFIFKSLCKMNPMLNLHLSYKPPSSWRILFWSGGYPRQFIYLKPFRALVVSGGGCCKEITILVILTPTGFLKMYSNAWEEKGV